MTYGEAARFRMPWGKYKGQPIDGVASTDEGLEYLDWLRGVREEEGKSETIDRALATYLDDPAIARDLKGP